jgi:hypothetical protein
LFFNSSWSIAQTANTKPVVKSKPNNAANPNFQGFLYYQEACAGIRLNTNGWNLFYQKTNLKTERKNRFTEWEFGHIRHEKEVKSASFMAGGGPTPPKSYVFGKQYSLYTVNWRIGYTHLLAYKAARNGVAVSFNYAAGPSLGILKPYYLILYYNSANAGIKEGNLKTEKFSEDNQEYFLDPNHIYGYAGFFKGIFRSKLVPGISTKIGFNFDFSSYHDRVKAIEVGVMNDTYLFKTPLMIYTANHKFWTSFYISMQLGSRK